MARAPDEVRTIHASCVALDGRGVLLLGPSGSGKSDLALRLIDSGFMLVADDRVRVEAGTASAPVALAGLIESRGLGIFRLDRHLDGATITLCVRLSREPPARLPRPERHEETGAPLIVLDPWAPSAVARIRLALSTLSGRHEMIAGALEIASPGGGIADRQGG